MGNVVPFGFDEAEVHSAAVMQLRRLTSQAKEEFWDALDVIRREEPANLSENAIIVRDTPFLRKARRLALFVSGRVLGMIEVFRRGKKLVATLDLDLLQVGVRDGWAIIRARAEPRMRGAAYAWSAAVGTGPDNHLWRVRKVKRTWSDVPSTQNTRAPRLGIDVRVKLRARADRIKWPAAKAPRWAGRHGADRCPVDARPCVAACWRRGARGLPSVCGGGWLGCRIG